MVRVLFVCLGNICRSPTAEGVMAARVTEAGLDGVIEIDSAGTIGHHAGQAADSRMRRHCSRRGYTLQSRARKFRDPQDFEQFDYLITMDDENLANVAALDASGVFAHKLSAMCAHLRSRSETEVPDPYYGGDAGFELVIDIIEEATEGLLARIRDEHSL